MFLCNIAFLVKWNGILVMSYVSYFLKTVQFVIYPLPIHAYMQAKFNFHGQGNWQKHLKGMLTVHSRDSTYPIDVFVCIKGIEHHPCPTLSFLSFSFV